MSGVVTQVLAATGSTGNNNHAPVGLHPGANKIALELIIEAVGATPTITYKLQGSMVEQPAAGDWTDIIRLPSDSDTAAISNTDTAVENKVSHVAQAHTRFYKRVRLVTSANTNVTYRANLYQQFDH